jgi:uncharacterized OB-fold protein
MGSNCNYIKYDKDEPTKICPVCGYKGKAILKLKGKTSVEIFLWVLFIVPGFVYSVWRNAGASYGCPQCFSDTMVPMYSPEGQKIVENFTEI